MGVTRHPLCSSETLAHLDDIPLDAELIQRLEASFHRVVADGKLADRFYDRLFASHPELRAMFPDDMVQQKAKLLATLSMVIARLVAPGTIVPHLALLGAQHATFGAQPGHYPLVCDALLAAMAETAGPVWTAELQADWHEAITLVGEMMLRGASSAVSTDRD